MKISFTKRAQNNFNSIKNYLTDEWGETTLEAVEQKTIDFLELLKEFPELGSIEFPDKEIRGFQLTKQIRVLYRTKKNNIILLAFFDVRQNPKKKLK
jgi:plasmid stabilization system protein ParE